MRQAAVELAGFRGTIVPVDNIDHADVAVTWKVLADHCAQWISFCKRNHDVIETLLKRMATCLADECDQRVWVIRCDCCM